MIPLDFRDALEARISRMRLSPEQAWRRRHSSAHPDRPADLMPKSPAQAMPGTPSPAAALFPTILKLRI